MCSIIFQNKCFGSNLRYKNKLVVSLLLIEKKTKIWVICQLYKLYLKIIALSNIIRRNGFCSKYGECWEDKSVPIK